MTDLELAELVMARLDDQDGRIDELAVQVGELARVLRIVGDFLAGSVEAIGQIHRP